MPLAGKRVVLKPNLVEYHRDKVINTHPAVVGAIIELCQPEGAAEVIVAEGPGHWRNVDTSSRPAASATSCSDTRCPVRRPQPRRAGQAAQPRPADRPGVPVCREDGGDGRRAHLAAEAEDAPLGRGDAVAEEPVRHASGHLLRLAEERTALARHRNSIVDIALTRTPHLAMVDGIVGMEGDGPLNGTARPVGALVMGNDLVAVDATGCRLMGLPASRIGTSPLAQTNGWAASVRTAWSISARRLNRWHRSSSCRPVLTRWPCRRDAK